MKKILSLTLLLTFIISACKPMKPTKETHQPAPETDSVATGIPAAPAVTPIQTDCPEPTCLTASLSLLELQNRSVDENVVKLFSVAVDEQRNRVYVAGIMTPNVAVLDGATEEWIGIVQTGITERGIKHVYFDSAAQYLYVFESTSFTLRRINVTTGEMAAPVRLDGGFANIAFVDETHTRFYLATKKGLTAFDGNSLAELYVVQGLGETAGSMVYDEATDSIYMLATQDKSSRSILIIEAANGQATGEIPYLTQANGRARWFHFDAQERIFFVGLERAVLFLDLNGSEVGAFPLQPSGILEDVMYDPATDQTFALSVERPENGEVVGIGGHVDVYDRSGNLASSFDFGRKPHNMRLNSANGHIYIANGDASVLWSIDVHAPTQAAALRLGDSVEQIVPSGDGASVYLSSRLGGSYLARYDLASGNFETFTAGAWPIPLRRDASGTRLFSLNAWDSALSVFDIASSQTLLGTIPLGIPAGSTDRLPDLAIDSTRQLAYAAYPEFGQVAVVSWATMQPVTVLAIPNAETGDTGGGPGQLQAAVNESAGRLFVYESRSRTLHIYDSANGHALLASVDLKAHSKSVGQSISDQFFLDAETNRLFLGALELDAATGQPTGRALPQGQKVIGADSRSNLYWVVDESTDSLLALDRDTLAVRHSLSMPEPAAHLPTFAYDPATNRLFVGYLVTARVYIYSIGDIP